MTDSLRRWLDTAGTRGVRVLVIVLIAFILVRVLKALTTRLVQIAKGQTRAAQCARRRRARWRGWCIPWARR